MTLRKKILILTPKSIKGAETDLAKLKKNYAYLSHESEGSWGILEIYLVGIGYTYLLLKGKKSLDEIIAMISDGIAHYQLLAEEEKLLDPPLRLTQPDPWLDQVFCDQPKTLTSYFESESLHPYLQLLMCSPELKPEDPFMDLTTNEIGKLKHKMIPQALELRDQLKREAAYMQLRFRERRFVFMLGETPLIIRHKRDLEHAILSIDEAIERAKKTTFVERVFELFA